MSWCWSICTLWPQHYNEASSWSGIVARKNPGTCGEVRMAGIRNPSQARRYRRCQPSIGFSLTVDAPLRCREPPLRAKGDTHRASSLSR
jgi:hypothetical protein